MCRHVVVIVPCFFCVRFETARRTSTYVAHKAGGGVRTCGTSHVMFAFFFSGYMRDVKRVPCPRPVQYQKEEDRIKPCEIRAAWVGGWEAEKKGTTTTTSTNNSGLSAQTTTTTTKISKNSKINKLELSWHFSFSVAAEITAAVQRRLHPGPKEPYGR